MRQGGDHKPERSGLGDASGRGALAPASTSSTAAAVCHRAPPPNALCSRAMGCPRCATGRGRVKSLHDDRRRNLRKRQLQGLASRPLALRSASERRGESGIIADLYLSRPPGSLRTSAPGPCKPCARSAAVGCASPTEGGALLCRRAATSNPWQSVINVGSQEACVGLCAPNRGRGGHAP